MKKFLLALLLLALTCSSVFAGQFVKGDAIVVFKAPEGQVIKASGLKKDGHLFASVNTAVNSVGAAVKAAYETLSEIDGKIFVHVHSDSLTTEELINELKKRDDVISASPNKINRPLARPNDEFYGDLWALERMNCPAAWDITTGSEDIYIAVMDSGVCKHPDLLDNIATGYGRDFGDNVDWANDSIGHGTHVSGIIGAVGNNEIGVTGVNWKVKIIPIKATNSEGYFPDSAVADTLNYLSGLLRDNPNMKIVALNMSYGGYSSYTPSEARMYDSMYSIFSAFDKLNRCLLVAAGGNEAIAACKPAPFDQPYYEWHEWLGFDGPEYYKGDYMYPASYTGLNNLIVVGAINSADKATDFTCWGDWVHVAAPGQEILSTYDNTQYEFLDGTSMATPYVSGTIGLLAAKYPNATTSQIKAAVIFGANSNINPVIYPYEYKCALYKEVITKQIDNRIKEGQLQEKDRESTINSYVQNMITGLRDFESLDGTGKVSRYGFIDVKGSLDKLSQYVANSQYLTPDELPADPEDSSGPTPTPSPDPTPYYPVRSSSSSGCNSGFAGLMIFAVLIISAKKFYNHAK
ncbi:MAG: S8 family serine peptidase [Synergistaceae bacterium]|nr:S8 family serine peptidase [Synergistaceae bacterium]